MESENKQSDQALVPAEPVRKKQRPSKVLFNVTNKFFLVLFVLLLLNLLCIVVFGNTFIERFYLYDRQQFLKNCGTSMRSALDNQEKLADALYQVEQNNVTVLLFQRDDANGKEIFSPIYYSRSDQPLMSSRYDVVKTISEAVSSGALQQLQPGGEPVLRTEQKETFGRLLFYSQESNGMFLILETPLEYIVDSSRLAISFVSLLSAVLLALGGIASFLIARKISRPIREIDQVAQKLTQLDFSRRCQVRSKDEIGALGQSINIMADRLESNIGLLQQRNELLQKDLQREEETNRLRREFIANVSHDFKTPLSLISAYAETLREDDGENSQAVQYCDIIVEQVGRMNAMVNQLLNLSRLESKMVTLRRTFFSINDLIYSVLTDCRILMEKNGIHCQPLLTKELYVEGDYQLITNVITNLVENAIKYAANEKILRIHLEERDKLVRIWVFDTCDPVPEEVLQHLFDSFYKADKSRGLEKQSYGLGLAIVKAIAELHGCQCGVEQQSDGLSFWFELPKVDMDTQEEEPEEWEESPEEENQATLQQQEE